MISLDNNQATWVNPLISLSSGILGIEVQQADTPLVAKAVV
jgi:hypothetical protein